MYVCMYVCMYVYMYVCMYICMYVCTYMYVCMHVRTYVRTYHVCMYMYICINKITFNFTTCMLESLVGYTLENSLQNTFGERNFGTIIWMWNIGEIITYDHMPNLPKSSLIKSCSHTPHTYNMWSGYSSDLFYSMCIYFSYMYVWAIPCAYICMGNSYVYGNSNVTMEQPYICLCMDRAR